jgi:PAS domain S-box-containing protein
MSWNSGAERINGYAASDILGQHFSRFLTPEDRAAGLADRALRVAADKGKYEAEGWRVRKDGSRFFASIVVDPIHDENGTLVGFAKITRDVTERQQAQAALDDAREKLAQAQKMEALGQLTGGIAHDFNNLLMIVSGHAQILRRGITDPQRLRAIDAIAAAASRGESLTRQLLAFARRQPLSLVVGLTERIEAVREMLGRSLRGNIEFSCDLPEGLWPAEVDPSELELALVNVAVNARDAMPEGGRITLSGRNVTLASDRAPGGRAGDFVAISMADTGTGIPHHLLPRVFEPFFTTKSVDKGTGLGLSQVYGFAQQSGGAVAIDSEVGRGTTVTIYLPRSHKPVAHIAPSNRPAPQSAAQGTILVVEDNSEVAHITSTLLEQLGYRVLHAGTAAEALERLQGSAVDLVFSDIVMPGPMDGIALAREIGTRHPGIPVLLTSGYSETARVADLEFTILRKPFQVASLDHIVREALQHRRMSAGEAANSPA